MASKGISAGYTIIERFNVGEQGFALGENLKAPSPYVTWQYRTADPDHFFWGHYTDSKEAAYEDFERRIEEGLSYILESHGQKHNEPKGIEYGSQFDEAEELYEEIELFGKLVLFTCLRVDRTTVPKGLYAYDIRETDGFSGIPCEIGKRVSVNHMGTILTREPIKGLTNGFRSITEADLNFGTGDCSTIRDYMKKYPPIKVRESEHER